MSGFNPLAARRYLEVARRVLGEDLALESVSPEIMLTKVLDENPVEDRLFKRVRHFSTGRVPVAANAAGRSTCQVINPVGSSMLVVITLAKILGIAGVGRSVQITIDGVLIGAGQAPCIGLDTRLTNVNATIPVQTRQAISNATGVNGIVVDEVTMAAGVDAVLPSFSVWDGAPLAILAPGHQFNIWDNALNEAAIFYVFGYERDARTEELVGLGS